MIYTLRFNYISQKWLTVTTVPFYEAIDVISICEIALDNSAIFRAITESPDTMFSHELLALFKKISA